MIQTKTMPSVYAYSIVPKLDPDAFLMARVTDWEDMNLMAGTARVYFDNSYIGESYINPRATNDTSSRMGVSKASDTPSSSATASGSAD